MMKSDMDFALPADTTSFPACTLIFDRIHQCHNTSSKSIEISNHSTVHQKSPGSPAVSFGSIILIYARIPQIFKYLVYWVARLSLVVIHHRNRQKKKLEELALEIQVGMSFISSRNLLIIINDWSLTCGGYR